MKTKTNIIPSALLALLCSALAGQGQTTSTWSGGNGSWQDAAKWTGSVPNAAAADIYIDNQPGTNSSVTLGITSLTFGRLRIDAGDRVDTVPGIVGIAVSSSAFAGAGELLLNGTFAIPQNLSLDGTKTINGSGKWLLGSLAGRPEITGVTNNNATIEGSATFGRLTNNSYPGTINNTGTVNANLAGAPLTFHSASNSTNTGTMMATNGATLDLNQGTLNNTGGQIVADGANTSNPIVRTGGFTITGGNLSGINGGELRIEGGGTLRDLTISGTARGGCLVGGVVTNNGIWHVGQGAGIDLTGGTTAVTFAGSGDLVLNATQDNLPELINQGNQQWTFQGLTVRGRGNVGYPSSNGAIDSVTVINQGTFQADVSGQTLLIDVANFDNRNGGFLRATGSGNSTPGGILQLAIKTSLKNTGGTIEALNLGRIKATQASLSRIEGGLVRNNGGFIDLNGMTLANPGTGMTLEGELTLGDPAENQQAGLVGVIENKGILNLKGSTGRQALLIIGENANRNVTLTGGGSLVLGDAANGASTSGFYEPVSGTTLANTNHTIRGFGFIGNRNYDPGLTLQNSSLVTANVAGRTLDTYLSAATNSGGIFSASDGGTLQLQVRNGFDNTGGFIKAEGGTVAFAGGTRITNGTLLQSAGKFNLSNAILVNGGSGITLEGTFEVDSSRDVGLVEEITNKGTIHLRPTGGTRSSIAIGLPGTLTNSISGGGEIVLGDASLPGANDPRIRHANGAYNNVAFTLNDQTLRGFGIVGFSEYEDAREMLLTNNGSISADANGKELSFRPKTLTNSPTKVMRATGGGILHFNPVTLTNTDAFIRAEAASKARFDGSMVLIGGTVESLTGGTMEFMRQFTARGGVAFNNAGIALFGTGGSAAIFEGLANGGSTFNNTTTGTIRKTGSGEYTLRTSLTSSGAMALEGGVLRNIGGGTITGGTHTAAADTDLTFQSAPGYTFSGNTTFAGAGRHWFGEGVPITLANAASKLEVANLNFNTATLTGPGLLSHTGILGFYDNSTNSISGTSVLTQPSGTATIEVRGQPLTFSNGADWENRGTVSFKGHANPKITGDGSTFFHNLEGAFLKVDKLSGGFGILDIPSRHEGTINIIAGSLSFEKPSAWSGGRAEIGAGLELRATSTALTFSGTANTSTGAGFLNLIGGGALTFPEGSRLTADRVQFNDTSGVSGPGELRVGAEARFFPTGNTASINGTQVNLLPGSTSLIQYSGGAWGLQNGAKLHNEGTLNFRGGFNLQLNTGGILENAGTMSFTSTGNNPTFGGDGTGLFRTLAGSSARFFPSNGDTWTVGWPFEFAGQVNADSGMKLTFNSGGLLNETAKLSPNHPNSAITFTGTTPFRVRGQANEIPGTGYLNLVGTTLQFEPSGTPGHVSSIAAGARVAFHGNNTVRGTGTLSSTGLVFQNGDQTVENATLETTGGDTSVWNATGKKITFTAGASFRNTGRFVIQSTVGGPGNPGFTGVAGTRFHNTSSGTLVHDSGSTTQFDIDFLNEGELEVRAGRLNIWKKISGRGGVAASGGAKVDLPLGATPLDALPNSLRATGPGSEITATLPPGDKNINLNADGGRLVAAGGGNLVAAGGGNLVAAGGGNLVAAGGGNLVAAGGGNLTATGAGEPGRDIGGNLVAAGGGNLVAAGGGNLVAAGGGNLVAAGGGNISVTGAGSLVNVNNANLTGGTLVAAGGGNLVAAGGLNLIGKSLASFSGPATGANAAGLIGMDGSTLIGNDGSTLVAAGGLNMVNGSQLIGNDGSTLVAAGGLNALLPRNVRNGDPVSGPGKIIARTNSLIAGNGTFNGSGYILSGSLLRPGRQSDSGPNEVGTLQWNGALEIPSAGSLGIQLGGPVAGTDHDRLNVSGPFVLGGNLAVSFVNGFGPGLTPASTFDIVVANGGVTSALDGTRVPVTNAYGSFLVSIVNGTTLRLSDYQTVPATFNRWAQRFGLTGADALPEADPNRSGLSNLMKYALGLDASASGNAGTTHGIFTDGQGNRYLTLSYTRPTGAEAATDLLYEPQRAASPAAGPWSAAAADVISTSPAVPGPAPLETLTVRSTHAIAPGQPSDFLRLRVVLQNP